MNRCSKVCDFGSVFMCQSPFCVHVAAGIFVKMKYCELALSAAGYFVMTTFRALVLILTFFFFPSGQEFEYNFLLIILHVEVAPCDDKVNLEKVCGDILNLNLAQ